jgi:hypothetical protein
MNAMGAAPFRWYNATDLLAAGFIVMVIAT